MNRHIAPVLALIVALALAAAGCGASAATPTTAPVAAPTAAIAAPGTTNAQAAAALSISGAVEKPMSWSLSELKALGTVKLDLMHPKTGKGSYEGVRFSVVLNLIKPAATAKTLTFSASDGYKSDVALADIVKCADCLIAIDGAGSISAAMPGMEGAAWARNLVKIEVK